jgi:hypothetical protein
MRAHSLDALRGYAILTMILSGTVAFGILPGWMYHTQVPPPNHVFDPSIYGISWVDLVFPFFLFSMGAAFPLSLGRQYRKGVSKARLCYKSVLRGLKLTFFAIYVQHLFYFVLGYDSTNVDFVISLAGFVWMFPLFMKNPFHLPTRWADTVNGLAYVIAALWIYVQPYAEGKPFSLYDSDIIILILADVAVFGSIIYLYTMDKPHARLLVLPILLGLFLSWKTMGSWQKALVDFTPFGWMFKWEYLRYLFIIIPGTMAGEMLERWIARGTEVTADSAVKRHRAPWLTVCSIALVIVNLCLSVRTLSRHGTGAHCPAARGDVCAAADEGKGRPRLPAVDQTIPLRCLSRDVGMVLRSLSGRHTQRRCHLQLSLPDSWTGLYRPAHALYRVRLLPLPLGIRATRRVWHEPALRLCHADAARHPHPRSHGCVRMDEHSHGS